MALTKEKKAEIMKNFATGKNDTGSVEIQVALLTERINELTEHFKTHIHDNHSKVGLMRMVGKRRSLLEYLKGEDFERYQALIKKLNLRK